LAAVKRNFGPQNYCDGVRQSVPASGTFGRLA
jgi:hypothetical protein